MMDKWINNNTISKILALAVAVLLWGMVHLDTGTPSSTLTVSYNNKVIDNVGIQASGLDESNMYCQPWILTMLRWRSGDSALC